jgi:hypothetical protein
MEVEGSVSGREDDRLPGRCFLLGLGQHRGIQREEAAVQHACSERPVPPIYSVLLLLND